MELEVAGIGEEARHALAEILRLKAVRIWKSFADVLGGLDRFALQILQLQISYGVLIYYITVTTPHQDVLASRDMTQT